MSHSRTPAGAAFRAAYRHARKNHRSLCLERHAKQAAIKAGADLDLASVIAAEAAIKARLVAIGRGH